jgi:23S rRNA-intervening sequence protein
MGLFAWRDLSGVQRHMNMAEGNGKATASRRHFSEIARGSAFECAATQDVLEVCPAITAEESCEGKDLLDRIVPVLTKVGSRGHSVRQELAAYADHEIDADSETSSKAVDR